MNDPPVPQRAQEEQEPEPDEAGLNIEVLRHRRDLVLTSLALLAVLSVTVFTAQRFFRVAPPDPAELSSVAQQAVRERFPPHIALTFGGFTFGGSKDLSVEQVTERLYDVSGRLTAIDQQAQSIDYVFTCTVEQTDGGGLRPTKLVLTPLF